MYLARGDMALIRHAWRGRVLFALPVTIVEDGAERSLFFLRAGTPTQWTTIDFASGSIGEPRPHVWQSTDVLKITPAGEAHSVWAMWARDRGPFLGWYVNLQTPLRRIPGGFLTWDQSLDVVIAPDLSWRWKDEYDLVRLQELGWMTRGEADAVRTEGERVIERVERRARPFDEPWPEWRPDPAWPTPSLADDWANLGPHVEPQEPEGR